MDVSTLFAWCELRRSHGFHTGKFEVYFNFVGVPCWANLKRWLDAIWLGKESDYFDPHDDDMRPHRELARLLAIARSLHGAPRSVYETTMVSVRWLVEMIDARWWDEA